jgi:hypothetical protein
MKYQKGQTGNPNGRPKGSANKNTLIIRDAVLDAFLELGGVEWLIEQANKNPTAFISLLAKILPSNIQATIDTVAPLTQLQLIPVSPPIDLPSDDYKSIAPTDPTDP